MASKRIEEFLKSLQGITADDLDPELQAELEAVLPDSQETGEEKGFLGKALSIIDRLVKGRGSDKADEDEEDEEDEEDKKGEEDEEAQLEAAAALLRDKGMKKGLLVVDTNEDSQEPSLEDLTKALLDGYRATEKPTTAPDGAKTLEAMASLAQVVKDQEARIVEMKKALDEQARRPVGTIVPFDLKTIDVSAGGLGMPPKDQAVSLMQKAFEHCRLHQAEMPMQKAIGATEVQAVENAYAYNDADAMRGVKPLLERAKTLVG